MKKNLKRISLLICIAMLFSAFAGCKKDDPAFTLYIDISNAGFGIEWLDPLIEIFQDENPSITVRKRSVVKNDHNYVNKFLSGVADTDLFFVETDVLRHIETPVTSGGVQYSVPFADLTDLFKTKIPNENLTIEQKMRPEYLAFNTVGGKNYTFPWMESMMGIVMNKNVYKEEWGKLPNTTDELIEFCKKIKNEVSPFIFSISDPYWLDIYEIWMTQYNSMEKMTKFYDGYAISGEYSGARHIPQMFLDNGLLEALNVLEELIKYENGYQDRLSYTLSFTDVQNKFLDTDSNVLFMANGTWLQREMSMNYDPDEINSEFIRTPVISALGTKLGISDSILSQIIDYADGTTDSAPDFTSTVSGLSREDIIEEVVNARKIVSSNHLHAAFIPAYSTKIDLAKKFIQLMASDRGIEAMLLNSQVKPAMKYDFTNEAVNNELSAFMQSVYRISKDSIFDIHPKGDLFRKGGLFTVNNQGYFTSALAAVNPNDRLTAQDIFMNNYNYVADTLRWQSFLNAAGIK